MSFDRIEHVIGLLLKIKFYIIYGKTFLWLVYFLVVEVYELPKSTSHVLNVPLTLECIKILSWSISLWFYFNFPSNDVLCKIAIWADDTAHKPPDLWQKVELEY